MLKKDFLEKVNDFLDVSVMPPATFGVLAIGDPSFVLKLRKGRECREKTQERVLAFMADWTAAHNINMEGLL